MEKKITDLEPMFNPDTQALWKAFEKSGSIEAFLKFIQKIRKSEKLVLAADPS